MKIQRTATVLLAVLLLTGCSGVRVTSDFDPHHITEMKAYRTYAWLPMPTDQGDDLTNSTLMGKRIRTAADHVLQKRGYEKAVSGTPDFLIGHHLAVEGKLDISTVNNYYGYGYGYWGGPWGYGYSNTYVRDYQEGTLILDIADGITNELVWRSAAVAEVNQSSNPEKRQQAIQSVVLKMLDTFPPKK